VCLPHEYKGLLGAPVTHAEIRDIDFMAVITAFPEKECDLGDWQLACFSINLFIAVCSNPLPVAGC